jgi:hypothetical protein
LFSSPDLICSLLVSLSNLVQVKLADPTIGNLSSISQKRFQLSNIYNYQNINVIGLALNGFAFNILTYYSFTAQPTYNYVANAFEITLVNAPNSTINMLSYSVIVVTSDANNLI